jgi:hypothetical protein
MKGKEGPRTRTGCRAPIVLVFVLSSLGMLACGASRSGDSTGRASVAPATTSGAITIPGRPIVGGGSPSSPSSGSTVRDATSRGLAGFRVHRGDNSIPDFGQEANASQRQSALTALSVFMHARATGEWSKACGYLARSTHLQLESFAKRSGSASGGCGLVLAALTNGHDAERVDTLTHGVAALRIKEKTAFALFYGPNAEKYVMPMENKEGAWKMTQVAPLHYPLALSTTAP